MSNFISSIPGGSLRDMPPESNVMPLPIRQIGALSFLPPRYSQTMKRGGWAEPCVTARNAPIFSALMAASSSTLVLMRGHSFGERQRALAEIGRRADVRRQVREVAGERAEPPPMAAPILRPAVMAFAERALSAATLRLASLRRLRLGAVFKSGILYVCAEKTSATARAR